MRKAGACAGAHPVGDCHVNCRAWIVRRSGPDVRTRRLRIGLACVAALLVATAGAAAHPLVQAAREQIGKTLVYDPAYRKIAFPNGDVPEDRGVCTDVVIRALRTVYAYDLQARVNGDIRSNFEIYPKAWGLGRADPNIDHRRVPNLQVFFQRRGWEVPVTAQPGDYQPGDLITQRLPGNLPHVAIVSDRLATHGGPLVIHNIGRGTREEDTLFAFPITGHYRLPAGFVVPSR